MSSALDISKSAGGDVFSQGFPRQCEGTIGEVGCNDFADISVPRVGFASLEAVESDDRSTKMEAS